MNGPNEGALYFNPAAGKGVIESSEIRAGLDGHSIEPIDLVDGFDVAADITSRQSKGERLFIAAGGDGTINHVVQAVANTDSVLGIVPLGTFNHFARDLHLPVDCRSALDIALHGIERQVDVGLVNGRVFANNISLGLYPEIVQRRERMRQKVGKWIAYPIALIGAVRKLPKLSMTIEAPPHFEVVHTRLFFVSANAYNLSHLGVLAPRESLQGGKLAAYWLPESFFGRHLIRALFRYARGKGAKIEKLRRLHTENLRVHSAQKSLRMGIDGELIDLEPPLMISVARRALQVRVPRS